MAKFHLISGDITAAKVDAIVNAANPMMLGGGGVDGAIHRAAGPKLLEACRRVKAVNGIRCPVGKARITSAGNLQARYVIHTVGPRYRQDKNPQLLLASAYRASLDLVLENGCGSIAFPAISCGAHGYPLDDAAVIALATCHERKYDALEIFFYLRGSDAIAAWETALKHLPPNQPVGELT